MTTADPTPFAEPLPDPFEQPAPRRLDGRTGEHQLVLDIDGFEGPIDLLLTLARDQKVDLAKISILQLADQYLAFVAQARRLRLELAADYLVMAAWLAYLKSRLLLPAPDPVDGETPEDLAQALAFQLQRLEAMRQAAARLFARPQLGRDWLRRGAPDLPATEIRVIWDTDLAELLDAYADVKRRRGDTAYTIPEWTLYSVERALVRLRTLIGALPDWATLSSFLPDELLDGLLGRSITASTLVASLELAKEGQVELRQDAAFGPVWLRRRDAGGGGDADG